MEIFFIIFGTLGVVLSPILPLVLFKYFIYKCPEFWKLWQYHASNFPHLRTTNVKEILLHYVAYWSLALLVIWWILHIFVSIGCIFICLCYIFSL
jgi:hypothetical protein